MANGQVIAFHEILGQHLPVGIPDMGFKECLGVILHVIVGDHFGQRGELIRHRRGIGVECDKDPAQPLFAADVGQGVVGFAEPFVLGHRRRAAQSPIQIVSPCMIRAHDAACVAAPFQQSRHAVAADIGHRPEHSMSVAQDNDWLPGQFQRDVVARVGQR